MLFDNTSEYKSWNNLKKQMNGFLCDSLKNKISYFYTRYHGVHNAYGRATINYLKEEIASFSWMEEFYQTIDVSEEYKRMNRIPSPKTSITDSIKSYKAVSDEISKKVWMPEGLLCDSDFINSITIYLKTDISSALNSDNYLLRVFAYLDRRVGKRTLIKLKNEVQELPEWVKQFYKIRCEAEGIFVFQERKNTLFHKFKSQDERSSFGGSSFIEIQFCKFPARTQIDDLFEKVDFWKNDSLYVSDDETFFEEYKQIFNCGLYPNLKNGVMDLQGINYYAPSLIEPIIKKTLEYKPSDYETLVEWLQLAKSHNGFYILGY